MGTASRNSSASRSSSPWEQDGHLSHNIPEMFRTPRGNMASSRNGQSQAAAPSLTGMLSAPPAVAPSGMGGIEVSPPPHVNLHDLRAIAADIKDTLSAAISELRLDIHALSDRVHEVEKVADRHDTVLRRATHRIDIHTLQLRDMQRHVEDLDNRGRRHNLRIRGMPESIEGGQISTAVIGLFNDLLHRPPQTAIEMERIHRALRPKGRDTDPPRDIICCLVDFKLKEEILRQARGRPQLTHDGVNIQIYQDLSGISLQHRRDLKPLLDALHTKGIPYEWKFPFCLSATTQGRTALLKVPEDLPHFCEILGISMVDNPNWYADFRRPTVKKPALHEEPMDAQDI